jgi:ABC-type branched-subunit amino acid transport system substrate-binding protein
MKRARLEGGRMKTLSSFARSGLNGPGGARKAFRSRRWFWSVGAAVLAAAVAVSVAQSTTTAKSAATPIVTYTFADVNTQGPQYKNIAETARVYGSWVNAHGGINGHRMVVKNCDTRGTPTAATACARKAVADHAVAVIGSFTFTGDAIVPVLKAGNTAYFGMCCPISPLEFAASSTNTFSTGNQPLYAVGLVSRAVQDGCKKMVGVIIQGAEIFEPFMSNAAKNLGKTITYVSLPATAQDYSPQVAQATSGGTDCLLMVVSETPYIAWMGPYVQSGSKARMYGPQGNLDQKVIAAAPQSATNGAVIAAMFTSLSLPAWKDYRTALTQYKAAKSEYYDTFGGQGTWAGYLAFTQIVKKMKGPINNRTFLAAASKAKVNLPGILPAIDFTKPWGKIGGPKGLYRLFNRSVVFNTVKNGKIVPLTTKFEDVGNLAK